MARFSAAYKAAHEGTSTFRLAPTTVRVSPGGQSNGQRQSQRCVIQADLRGVPVAVALRVIDGPIVHWSYLMRDYEPFADASKAVIHTAMSYLLGRLNAFPSGR